MQTTTILPPGFAGVLSNLIAAKKASAPAQPKRRGLLADVERDVALGKAPPPIEFATAANYTYNRHAEALYNLWQSGDLAGLQAYPIGGVNTYSRALQRYRTILVDNLQGGLQ